VLLPGTWTMSIELSSLSAASSCSKIAYAQSHCSLCLYCIAQVKIESDPKSIVLSQGEKRDGSLRLH
jgi:hypothetical protein